MRGGRMQEVGIDLPAMRVQTGAIPAGVEADALRNSIGIAAADLPGLGVRILVTIVRSDGESAVAILDGDQFHNLGRLLIRAGERGALLAHAPDGKAN